MLSRFHLILKRHGQTDRQTELLYQYRASVCWCDIKMKTRIALKVVTTINSLVETHYTRTLPLEPSLYNFIIHILNFPCNVRLFHRRIATFSAHCDFFILRLMNTLVYLFTEEFLTDNIYDSFCRAMLCKRGLCCHAESMSVTFVNSGITIFRREPL